MALTQLSELFLHEVQDLLSAEKQILSALPKVAELAASDELKASLTRHAQQTEAQRDRLIKSIELLGQEPGSVECRAMKGLLQEGLKLAGQVEEGPLRDLAIIGAAKKVEHYEISGYSSLVAMAENLGLGEQLELLDKTLDEERDTARTLTDIAFREELPRLSSGHGESQGKTGTADSMGQTDTEKEKTSMRTAERERDQYGRFVSEGDNRSNRGRDDDDRGGRSYQGQERDYQGRYNADDDRGNGREYEYNRGGEGRGWYGDPQGHSEAARRGWEERGGGRASYDYDDRGGRNFGGRERDDQGRFTSDYDRGGRGQERSYDYNRGEGRGYDYDDRGGRNYGGGRDRDDQGRFISNGGQSGYGYNERSGRNNGGRSGYDYDDRAGGNNGGRDRDDQGRFPSNRGGYGGRDRDYEYNRGGEGRGWYGDPQGHSEAARRGWDEREGGRSRYEDDRGGNGGNRSDQGRYANGGESRDYDNSRGGGEGHGGWYGDSQGHSEAARRGWENRSR
jgi:ferritin-like metal-binding protein YciE